MISLHIPGNKKIDDIKLIMFDKDGTIFDIHHYWCSIIKLRAEVFWKMFNKPNLVPQLCNAMGVNEETGKLKPDGPVGIKSRKVITEIVSQTLHNNDIQFSPDEVESVFKEVDSTSSDNLDDFLEFLPGVVDFIKNCHQAGLKLSIATTDITTRAVAALTTKKIEHYFTLIYGADAVENTKPAPDMGLMTLKETNIDSHNAVMIGDHIVDIDFAKNANLKAGIGVSTGLLSEQTLKTATPYVIDNLSKIKVTKNV